MIARRKNEGKEYDICSECGKPLEQKSHVIMAVPHTLPIVSILRRKRRYREGAPAKHRKQRCRSGRNREIANCERRDFGVAFEYRRRLCNREDGFVWAFWGCLR